MEEVNIVQKSMVGVKIVPKEDGQKQSTIEQSTVKLRQTIMSFSGQYKPTIPASKVFFTICAAIFYSVIAVALIFVFPSCTPWDNECHESYLKYTLDVGVFILGFHAGSCMSTIVGKCTLQSFLNSSFSFKEMFFIGCFCGTVSVAFIEILRLYIPVIPFIFPVAILGSWVPSMYSAWIIIYYNIRDVLDEKEQKDCKKTFIWNLHLFSLATCVPILYVVFGVGYRLLQPYPVVFYFYIIFGFGILRESLLVGMCWIWSQFDSNGFPVGQVWVFVCHALMSSILRGNAAGNPMYIISLSLSDFFAIFSQIMTIKKGLNPMNWLSTMEEGTSLFDDEHGEHTVKATMYLLLEELVEVTVAFAYIIAASIVWFLPGGQNLGGFHSDDFGYNKIDDFGDFVYSLLLVVLIEILSFAVIMLCLSRYMDIKMMSGLFHFIDEFGLIFVAEFGLAFVMFFVIPYIPFNVDLSFQFDWM